MGFGAMRLTGPGIWGPPEDVDEAIRVLRRAVELGINLIDTADSYGPEVSEDLIRQALHPYPDDLVIATKVGPLRDATGMPSGEAPAARLRELVEEDLRRLGLDRLDLVYLRVGGMAEPGGTPIGERFAALAELRAEGLIRHLGVSNVSARQLAEARAIAPVAAVQNHFHLQYADDAGLPARCEEAGIAFVPFFPLGGGHRPLDRPRLEKVAARYGATAEQVALAGLLAASPVVLAIPGTGSLDHLEQNVAAAGLRLTGDDLAELTGGTS